MEDEGVVISEVDLAQVKKKEEFDANIIFIVNQMKDSGKTEMIQDGILIKANEDGYDMFLEGTEIKFGTISKESIIEYDVKVIEQYRKYLEEQDLEDEVLGKLPEADELFKIQEDEKRRREEIQENHEKEDEEKVQTEGKEKTEEETEEDKENNENNEEKTPETAEQQIEPQPNWIKVNLNRQADTIETIGTEIGRKAGTSISEMYIVPDEKNIYNYKIMVKTNDGYKEVNMRKTAGINPAQKITVLDNNGTKEVVAVQMLEINNNRMIAITYGGAHDIKGLMATREGNDYVGLEIVNNQKQGETGNKPSEIREKVGSRMNAQELNHVFLEIKELEKRGVTEDVDISKDAGGIEVHELSEKGYYESLVRNITEDLRDEVSHASERELYAMASEIARRVTDDDINYDKAKQEAKEKQNEQGDPRIKLDPRRG